MKEFLQGKWLKHPFHPILVHVPTAVWPAALLFDILANLGVGGNAMVQTSFYCILFGVVAALAAIPTGLADWLDIKRDRPAWRIGLYHMILNISITILQAINVALRWGDVSTAATVGTLPFILSIVSVLLLAVSGYLGGTMVYDYGVGIARLSKKKWRRIAQEGGANVPTEDGKGEAAA
jgi:uncharacterized membrane protein